MDDSSISQVEFDVKYLIQLEMLEALQAHGLLDDELSPKKLVSLLYELHYLDEDSIGVASSR